MTLDPYVLRTAALCIVALCLGAVVVLLSGRTDFRERWLVWLAAAPVVLAAAALPHGFAVLAVGIGLVGGAELATLAGRGPLARAAVLVAALAPPVLVAVTGRSLLLQVVTVGALALVLPAGLWLRPSLEHGGAAPGVVVALGLLGLPLAVLATADPRLVLAAVVAVSLGDVAGFAGGHAATPFADRSGRLARLLTRPLSRWSPAKTVAGAVASVVVGTVALVALDAWWLAPLVPVWGVVGDLRESRVKRIAGVKDAGRWLPGFGGLLDRVDSTLGAMVGLVVVNALVLVVPTLVVTLGEIPS